MRLPIISYVPCERCKETMRVFTELMSRNIDFDEAVKKLHEIMRTNPPKDVE